MTKLSKIIRERFLSKRNAAQPIKLGASTKIIVNPTMEQSRNRFDDKTKNADEKDKGQTKAAASLTNPQWR
jgi:hypothetical protein